MKVIFIVNKTGERVEKSFDSPYIARKFMIKLKYSKKLTYVGYSYV